MPGRSGPGCAEGTPRGDLRTWLGTVHAAVALAAEDPPGESDAAQRRHVARAVKRVARQLGNTPAVARRAYVDPRVIDRYEDGVTLDLDALPDEAVPADADAIEDVEPLEAAVVDLIEEG